MADCTLYDRDFVGWTAEQARLLREAASARVNIDLDWEQLAEGIEDLGKSEVHALASGVRRVVAHLLKLQFSPATLPRRGWVDSIVDARGQIQDEIAEIRSLRPRLPEILTKQRALAAQQTASALRQFSEMDAADNVRTHGGAYTDEQNLGDWFPETQH